MTVHMRTPTPTQGGMLLKARRIAAGLTPADIAKRIGTGERQVWRYEATGRLPRNAVVRDRYLRILSIDPAKFPKPPARKKP